jgi:pentatricopeptide repeat protein
MKKSILTKFQMAELTYNYQYDPDTEENPLHIALHVLLENQLEAGQPTEVYQLYDSMRKRKCSHHDTIHLIAALLAPLIVIALQRNGAPDVELYRSLLRKYKGKKPGKIWALMDKDLDPLIQK